MSFSHGHRPDVADDLSTASAGTSQAPSAAVDKSAPSTADNRFATARFRLIADD
jgi:hypothetical protein